MLTPHSRCIKLQVRPWKPLCTDTHIIIIMNFRWTGSQASHQALHRMFGRVWSLMHDDPAKLHQTGFGTRNVYRVQRYQKVQVYVCFVCRGTQSSRQRPIQCLCTSEALRYIALHCVACFSFVLLCKIRSAQPSTVISSAYRRRHPFATQVQIHYTGSTNCPNLDQFCVSFVRQHLN